MTIVFTLRHKDMILVASDRRATTEDLDIVPLEEPKIFQRGNIIVGASGDSDTCTMLVKTLRDHNQMDEPGDLLEHRLRTIITKKLKLDSGSTPDVKCHVLVVLLHRSLTFRINVDKHLVTVEKVTPDYFIGCGSSTARGYVNTCKERKILSKISKKADLIKFATDILQYTAKNNAGCGNGGDIIVYDKKDLTNLITHVIIK